MFSSQEIVESLSLLIKVLKKWRNETIQKDVYRKQGCLNHGGETVTSPPIFGNFVFLVDI